MSTTAVENPLSDHHRAMLEVGSGIHPDLIAARGYRTVTTKAALKRLGFGTSQLNVPALLIPIHNPTGDVALYQSRPDTPRIVRERSIKYETPFGAQMRLDMPPTIRDKRGDPKTPLWITEGCKKADALASRGLCAVALVGVWNFRGTNELGGKTALGDWESLALNDRDIYVVFDSDVMIKKAVHAALARLKGMLEHRGARVRLVYLPTGDGAKTGVDDYLVAGYSVDDLLSLATDELRGLEPEDDAERAGPYLVKNGAICHEKSSRDGPTVVPLCNFSARITEERLLDDGAESVLTFAITGTLADGTPLPETEVPADRFAGMAWTAGPWGSRAIVHAGQGAKDYLRAAIQTLSGNVPRRTTFTHLGFREVGGVTLYLHAGGALGSDGSVGPESTRVDAPQGLELFDLPDPPTGAALGEAVRASLATLDLAPDAVTVPLLGAVYRAPLGDVDFSIHLMGSTGAGKSELTAIAQQHSGAALDARHLPASWSATANFLEGLAFSAKDTFITIDDYQPEGSSHNIARFNATAARIFRAAGNGAARGRMRADGSLRPSKPPRALIVSTGEDAPKGHSIRARLLILELEPGALDWGRVSRAQGLASSGLYASAFAGYVRWLAGDYAGRRAAFRAAHHRCRDALQRGGHKRTVDAGAQLLATYETLFTFAREVGALSEPERAALWQRVEAGVQTALAPQVSFQAQADPVARFSELLTGIFTSGRAHIVDVKTGDFPGDDGWGWKTKEISGQYGPDFIHTAGGVRIGWLDGPNLYLEPGATYAALQSFARDQGEAVPVTQTTLWKRLSERGVLLSKEPPRSTVRKQGLAGTGGRVYVLHLAASYVAQTEPTEPPEPPPDGDGTNTPLTAAQSQNAGEPPPKSEPQTAVRGSDQSEPQRKTEPQESASSTVFGTDGSVGSRNTGVETAAQDSDDTKSLEACRLTEQLVPGAVWCRRCYRFKASPCVPSSKRFEAAN